MKLLTAAAIAVGACVLWSALVAHALYRAGRMAQDWSEL